MKILHIEDNPGDADLVRRLILTEWPGSEITLCSQASECRNYLETSRFDLILSDFTLPSFNGMDALETARVLAPDTPFIFLSGTIGEDRAIEALHRGADDYVLKDRMKRLATAIRRSLGERAMRRQKAEAERRIHEQAEMLNQAHDAIVITSLDSKIMYWNAGAEGLFGWGAAEAVGKTSQDLFNRETTARILAAVTDTVSKGAWRGEMQLHDKGGRPLVVDIRRTLIRDDAGLPKAHLSISTDITGKKRLEEQLLRMQRLENIGLLAAGIAHDLNNVLAPILLVAPMLRDRVTSKEDLGMLTMLEKSAERGAGLVRQILSFAQGTAGESRIVQVKHLINDIGSIIAETFPKNVRFENRTAADLWTIDANPTQIHQVLLNLCVNARDAMPGGGVVRISAENRVLDEAEAEKIEDGRSGAFILVQVADTGTGIPPEVLQNIWKPFFTTKEKDKGTGLGLSTVRGILEKHRGFISVETKLGEGTRFKIFIPASQAMAGEDVPGPKTPAAPGKGELILIVDDEKHVRDLTATILSRGGYRVLVVDGGADAVKLFAQRGREIRLVVLDAHMADFDGPSVARALARMDPEIKILAMSGLSMDGDGGEPAEGEGYAAGFLHKPFKPADLIAAVQSLLQLKESGAAAPT